MHAKITCADFHEQIEKGVLNKINRYGFVDKIMIC